MQVMFHTIWVLLQCLVGYNLVLPIILYIAYLLSTKKKFDSPQPAAAGDYAVIVTAYEQTDLLPSVVASLLKMNHPDFMVYVVADNCDVSDLRFDDERVILLRPPEVLASNTMSHFYAIRRFVRKHNRLTIIDSDNLVDPDFLTRLDACFSAGFSAVQGVRKAKNLNTTYACLDAARDIYYHFYDGLVLFTIGSSATLAGSGMAFETNLYRECLEHQDVQGAGFDKVLQAAIVSRGYRIAYAQDAVVYDEKTSRSEQLVKQRARWINTWFKYFGLGFTLLSRGALRFDRNQFVFGLVLLRPPLFIFLALSVVCLAVNIILSPLTALIWLAALCLFIAGFAIALASSDTNKKIYSSLKNIPQFVFLQMLSLSKIRKANQHSVATKHYQDTKEII